MSLLLRKDISGETPPLAQGTKGTIHLISADGKQNHASVFHVFVSMSEVVEVSTLNPNKISLNLPGTLFATGFGIVSGAASIIETLVQNTALRIARLFDALKPLLRSSSSLKSKKRETDFDFTGFDDPKGSNSEQVSQVEKPADKTPVKTSFAALTQQR